MDSSTSTVLLHFVSSSHADAGYFNPLVPQDATYYATKMAATVENIFECRKFKVEIMSYAKASSIDGKTIMSLVQSKQKATTAGCA